MESFIEIQGAHEHNLKNVNLKIPIGKITCIYGPSGSGKTSLAFHTLYAESKRRFLNSFPTYLKFFSDRPGPVKVDSIAPVLPVFGLPQNNPLVGTRTNVADVMQITDLLSNLFAHFSIEKCPRHNQQLVPITTDRHLVNQEGGAIKDEAIIHFFTSRDDFAEKLEGAVLPSRSLKSKRSKTITEFNKEHDFWELFRVRGRGLSNLDEKLRDYLSKQVSIYYSIVENGEFSSLKKFEFVLLKQCPDCDYREHPVTKHAFNPYSPIGACRVCNGFGATLEVDMDKVVDMHKSIDQGGLKILESKRFDGLIKDLLKDVKLQKFSTSVPIKDLPEEFWDLFQNGGQYFCGLDDMVRYLEGKKYKANVRIFLRSIQREKICEVCKGSRVISSAHNYCITKRFFPYRDFTLRTISQLHQDLCDHESLLLTEDKAKKIVKKICSILQTAINIGLDHLDLNRKAKSVSAGEYQRLLLLKYLSYEGTGALFVFDEPSLGLSHEEIDKLYQGFQNLIDQGNTVLLVEHSSQLQLLSDYVIQMGPGPGHLGGEVIYAGKYRPMPELKSKSITAVNRDGDKIKVIGPQLYGKRFQDVEITKGDYHWVHGRSGSGKTSTLINILANEAYFNVHKEYLKVDKGSFDKINGKLDFEDVIIINSNISRYTSRSTVGSATDLISIVRKHFLNLSVAKAMGLKDGHLSTNSELGQCAKCEGKGVLVIEMQFLEDVVLECEDCHGKGLKDIYANLSDGRMTVHEAFHLPIAQLVEHIRLTPKYQKIYEYMKLLNLSYLSLARSITSLSGGEKQRIYLLSKLQKKIENSLLIFENISFGLSEIELYNLASFLQSLQVDGNNTIVVIDQNPLFKSFAGHEINFT